MHDIVGVAESGNKTNKRKAATYSQQQVQKPVVICDIYYYITHTFECESF